MQSDRPLDSTPGSSTAARDQAEERYAAALGHFTDAVWRAIATSRAGAGLDAGARRYWASVLFTRLCTMSFSILSLCPRSKANSLGNHWDFGSVASLTRNLFECALHFFYLTIEPVSDDEWRLRLKVMQLHDCKERERMFRAFDPNDPQLTAFDEQADELKQDIEKNPCFAGLQENLQKTVLRAERPSILTQDEILQRMGLFSPTMRGYYRYFSSHAHSFPLAYYRMGDHDRGRGVETDGEKIYIAFALQLCTELLTKSTNEFQESFSGIASFAHGEQGELP
jgi:hypothetical protein